MNGELRLKVDALGDGRGDAAAEAGTDKDSGYASLGCVRESKLSRRIGKDGGEMIGRPAG